MLNQPRAAVRAVDPVSHLLPGIPEDAAVSRFLILSSFIAIPVTTVKWKTEIRLMSSDAIGLLG
jgi:hypothetical protein